VHAQSLGITVAIAPGYDVRGAQEIRHPEFERQGRARARLAAYRASSCPDVWIAKGQRVALGPRWGPNGPALRRLRWGAAML
jgi:hypothetical protein